MTTETTTTDDPHGTGYTSAEEARRAMLRHVPVVWADPPPEQVGKLPRATARGNKKGKCKPPNEGGDAPAWQDHFCGGYHGLPAVHLDFMGHADVTLALIAVDPEWSLSMGWNTAAGPIDPFFQGPATLLAELTVLGVTRPCIGTIEDGKTGTENTLKELMGDAIRNGALRFGIATGLWSKSQRAGNDPDAATGKAESFDDATSAQPAQPPAGWSIGMMKAKAFELVVAAGFEGQAAKDTATAMWGEVVGMVDGDHEFRGPAVDQVVADFRTWLAQDGDDPNQPPEVTGSSSAQPPAGVDETTSA